MVIGGAGWEDRVAAAVLHELGVETTEAAVALLRGTLDDDGCAAFSARFPTVAASASDRLDDAVPSSQRRRIGAFFTPGELAARIARLAVPGDATGWVVDLSCGDGALLEAALEWAPGVRVRGVERELVFAAAAAARIRGRGTIVWGDGLAARSAWSDATAVIGNPPYVGEKGNRAIFDAVRAAHPELEAWFAPRMDLHYLFLHRGLDLLKPGGRLVYLTSEYWLTATGGGALRADLVARTDGREFVRLGAGAFSSAPGHHSLLFAAARRTRDARPCADGWHPFATVERSDEGVPLSELCHDRQGFVSGADRVTRQMSERYGWRRDAPIFLWREAELPTGDRDLFRPLVRRSDCSPNEVFTQSPARDWVLWSDGDEDEETARRIEGLLAKFRPMLEQRREARLGGMPWRRLWWPRQTADYARPKLVVPRRASTASMCLDLSGSHVSSDCTFLFAPDEVDAVPWLVRVMLAANSPAAMAQLRAFGKTKGAIMEFYADPLKAWRLPVERRGGQLELVDPALEARAREIAGRISSPSG